MMNHNRHRHGRPGYPPPWQHKRRFLFRRFAGFMGLVVLLFVAGMGGLAFVLTRLFGGSGQTQREYCEQRGLKFSAFRNWLYSLRREAPGRSKPGKSSGRFIQVVPSAPKPSVVCKLQVGRAEMLFSELPPAAYVGELLRLMDR